MTSLIELDTESEGAPAAAAATASHSVSAGPSATGSIRSVHSNSSSSSRPLSPKEKAEAKVAVLQKLDKLGDLLASMSPTQDTMPAEWTSPPADSGAALDEVAGSSASLEEAAEEHEDDDDDDFGDFAAGNAASSSQHADMSANGNEQDDDDGGGGDDDDDFGDFGDFEDQGNFPSASETVDASPFSTAGITCTPEGSASMPQLMPWIDIINATSDELSRHLADFLSTTQLMPACTASEEDMADGQAADTFNSLLASVDTPWEMLIAPWDESDVFQWRQSKTRQQFLGSLGLSTGTGTGTGDDAPTGQPRGEHRSASPAATATASMLLKQPSLSTDSRSNTRASMGAAQSGRMTMVDSRGGFGSAAPHRLDEGRAQQLVAMHPDTLRSLSGAALVEMREELVRLEKAAMVELHRLLDAREQARIDAELLNKSIELLVSQAQKRKEHEIARRRKAAASGGFKERFSRIAGLRRTPTPDSAPSTTAAASNQSKTGHGHRRETAEGGGGGGGHHRRQSM
ncbi:hypothetical protein SYNPS1DRAFT_31316 [Syncephalis pseudoplumigaleata]|uniref:Uncharacterized protein n=1 Tax=Syncephalis pseudoplumigaleata TaxID=1712513 RepID=A0A4P9YT84_9FUNG|nr:hypothetical protein SYNPS1DRAFT_31316 [Syncephalis pseudoplumigaleata]|eukprot:RKP22994.1 hypothetical protein SYNPS1DRAFT_31316 [Syncephalis pseudoplumigaleata]